MQLWICSSVRLWPGGARRPGRFFWDGWQRRPPRRRQAPHSRGSGSLPRPVASAGHGNVGPAITGVGGSGM
eukprot:2273800-Alexandrium_andersonii.AAC.1